MNRSRPHQLANPRAYLNFIGGDCDFAITRCVLDHLRGGCYLNHGKKTGSILIKHSTTYHTHKRM